MKHKLLFCYVLFSVSANIILAQSTKKIKDSTFSLTTIVSKTNALIPAPLATAGSACKEISDATVTVFVTASGNSGMLLNGMIAKSRALF
jgi:hypothetical protein